MDAHRRSRRAKEGHPVQSALVGKIIAASGLKVQTGGGVRSTDDIRKLIDAGANRVVVGTKAIEDWPWFESLMQDAAFAHRVVLAARRQRRHGRHPRLDGDVDAPRGRCRKESRRVARRRVLYTDVAKDGMMSGPNVEQTQKLAEAGPIPVIASGGVGNIDHIKGLLGRGIWGVIVGRSLYEGTLDLRQAITLAK